MYRLWGISRMGHWYIVRHAFLLLSGFALAYSTWIEKKNLILRTEKRVYAHAHYYHRGPQKAFAQIIISRYASLCWATDPSSQSPFYKLKHCNWPFMSFFANPIDFPLSLPGFFLFQSQVHHRSSDALVHAAANIPQHPHSKVSARVSQRTIVRSPGHCQHGYCLRG